MPSTKRPKAPRPESRPKAKPKSKPKPKAPERELGDRRRHELLEAAYALTAEKGLEGLRTRDVAARAKVNISTLHYYFGTKQALLSALVVHTTDKFSTGAFDEEARQRDPLHAHFTESWQVFQNTPNLSVVLEELSTRSRRDPSTKAAFRGTYQHWNGGVAELLRGLVAAGQLRPGTDPEAGAFIVTSFIIGASVQLGINGRAFDFVAVARELERWAGSRLAAKV